jgi:hypothetical protein
MDRAHRRRGFAGAYAACQLERVMPRQAVRLLDRYEHSATRSLYLRP